MKVAVVVSALFVAVVAVAGPQPAATSGGRPSVESCADAIYTTPANAPPKPVQAVTRGAAVFNSLAHLTTQRGMDKPTKAFPFYTVKSPLTILARARRSVTIILVGAGDNVALLYSRKWLQRLAAWHYTLADVPNTVRLPLCRDTHTKLPLNTQYAGGFLLRKPGCVTIEVQAVGESTMHRATVPIGVSRC
ncbi:MAG: hypothetical protein ABSB24_03890 [Gaiellaceae bacterium]|jgi:hypothetical protein